MPELICTARRIGDYESRTEEYELLFSVGEAPPRELQVRYQAARAYEINAALDSATETARAAISDAHPNLSGKPTDEALAKFAWRAVQSVKYDEGASKTSALEI
ncbi:MAG TPA: hypothetical protein VFJ72_14640 [Rubrobacteraceae bacterium]|nr:hypothetical protein [Rubrobacteraceae bacterium]